MSKHEKHVRRERRKTDRTRRLMARLRHPTSHIPHAGAAALAAAAVIAAGTQAYAEQIRFDNPAHGGPGHYHWFAGPGADAWLDVTLPATEQMLNPYPYYEQSTLYQRGSGANTIFRGSDAFTAAGLRVLTDAENNNYGPSLFNSGELIPPPGGGTYYGRPYSSASGWFHYSGYNFIPEGVPTYLGVLWGATYYGGSFTDANYGWIGVVRTGQELEALAWGYETEPGVSIPAGVPEPGSLALLAFGACAAMRRRRPA